MTIASCRMIGNRSGTRSSRSGLTRRKTTALMSAAASASLANAASCAVRVGRESAAVERERDVGGDVGGEQDEREPELAPDEPVDA